MCTCLQSGLSCFFISRIREDGIVWTTVWRFLASSEHCSEIIAVVALNFLQVSSLSCEDSVFVCRWDFLPKYLDEMEDYRICVDIGVDWIRFTFFHFVFSYSLLSQSFEEGVTLFQQEIELTAMSQYNRHICPRNFCSLCIEPSSSKVASTEGCECDAALFSAGFLFAQPESHTCMHIKHTHTHTHNFSFVV